MLTLCQQLLLRLPRLLRLLGTLLIGLGGLAGLGSATAAAEQPVPAQSGRVIDQTQTLSAAQVAALDAKLAAFEAEAGPQIVVLMVGSTQPEDIAAYAQRVGDAWKIGRREVGDGLLLVVAKGDRRVRIEVAKALEGAVPDLAARQIIDQHLRPAFRADDYAGGLNQALDALMARIRGEALPAPQPPSPGRGADGGGFTLPLIPTLIIGLVVVKLFGRRLGAVAASLACGGLVWWAGEGLLMAVGVAVLVLLVIGVFGLGRFGRRGWVSSGGRGGWSGGVDGGWSAGGSADSGGFSSGGGGDFGGGGASGDW